jgi:uncharacterized membrane protein (DUF485 family)
MSEMQRGHLQLLEDPDFRDLVARKNRISNRLTVLTLIVYYGFILLIAFKREVFGSKVAGNVTFGIFLGIGVIIACFFLTGVYVRWANRNYDAMIDRLKQKAGHGGP